MYDVRRERSQCHICDMMYLSVLNPEHIIKDGEDYYLNKFNEKTNKEVFVPIDKRLYDMLEKYNFKSTSISNQKFNEHLKKIAEEAGIKETVITHITKGGEAVENKQFKYELVTSHVARRSFATNYYKMGVDTLQIMAITGHKTEKEFLKYIKVTGEEKADLFEKSVNEKQKPKVVRKPKATVKAKATVKPKPKAKIKA